MTGLDPPERDAVDLLAEQWRRERPDLDPGPMTVVGRISRAHVRLHREVEALFERHGLPPGGFDVLATLRRAGEPYRLSPTRLHRSLMIASGSMTARLDRLEALRLVERSPDPHDRRALLVGLTPAGRELVDVVIAEHLANEDRLLAGLDRHERAALAALLRKLLLALGDAAPE
jgi:DNA-binding MarR family transcriptional regulator